MHSKLLASVFMTGLLAFSTASAADKEDLEIEIVIETFKEAPETAPFFADAYGYAIFPTVGKGGIGIGGARGKGRVYQKGEYIGDATLTQVSVGFQFGGQAFSQIIFFEDERALNDFTGGNFEFGAEVSALALNVGAQASAGSGGASAGASTGDGSAHTESDYEMGMAVFTVAKGGLMYQAAIGGQKFKYSPLK